MYAKSCVALGVCFSISSKMNNAIKNKGKSENV